MNHYLYKLLLLSLILFSTNSIYAENQRNENAPLYDGGQLVIPRVDTIDKAGVYQEATFVYNSEINAWHLQSYDEAQEGISIDDITHSVIGTTIPVQVLLQVKGYHVSCGNLGKIDQRMIDNKFEVRIYTTRVPDGTICTQDAKSFLKVIPLNVYGLNAGIYEYSVNDSDTKTFQLLQDNSLEECFGIGECNQVITGQ